MSSASNRTSRGSAEDDGGHESSHGEASSNRASTNTREPPQHPEFRCLLLVSLSSPSICNKVYTGENAIEDTIAHIRAKHKDHYRPRLLPTVENVNYMFTHPPTTQERLSFLALDIRHDDEDKWHFHPLRGEMTEAEIWRQELTSDERAPLLLRPSAPSQARDTRGYSLDEDETEREIALRSVAVLRDRLGAQDEVARHGAAEGLVDISRGPPLRGRETSGCEEEGEAVDTEAYTDHLPLSWT